MVYKTVKRARQRRWHETHASLPEVTISAQTEIGQAEEEIIVPLQRSYTGREPVISASLADTPCTTLGVQGLLDELNTTLGTTYSLNTPSLPSLLKDCIRDNYDFGTAYGHLRLVWYTNNWRTVPDELRKWEEQDQEKRRRAIDGNHIVDPSIYPRHVWDLYSNRVVPQWVPSVWPDPISHAWVDEKDRMDVWTPINRHEWPVPIPKDANLNLIRIELLNLGLEYVWLDVLCLRQRGGLREDLRVKEWMLDVPTIGRVYYVEDMVYCYLSGLGQPLSVKPGYFDSDRCWFNRAWTLQEVGTQRKICGDTPNGPLHAKPIDKYGNYETEILTRFHKRLQSLSGIIMRNPETLNIFRMLAEMRDRVSSNPVDKVAGMAFLLWPMSIPAYYENQSLEDAWSALVNAISEHVRGNLFFLYPEPGDAGTKWRPSWDQLMTKPLPRFGSCKSRVYRDTRANNDQCRARCIEKGFVRGLAGRGTPGEDHQHGELLVEDAGGITRTFKIIANPQYPIPEDTYTLVKDDRGSRWVVGIRLPEKSFEKMSSFEISKSGKLSELFKGYSLNILV